MSSLVTPVAQQQVQLDATLISKEALRSTPAGIAALNFVVAHASTQNEAGGQRLVQFELQCLCLGPLAEQIALVPLGSQSRFTGFMAPNRKGGKQLKLHVTALTQTI